MICYRDMTFCPFNGCKRFGVDCHRSLTEDVRREANEWWGVDGEAPIAQFVDKPDCYEEKDDK